MLERYLSHTEKRKQHGHEGRHWVTVTTSQDRSMSVENWNKKQVHFPWEPVRKNYTSQFCFSHSKICFQLLTSRNGKINVHCSKPQVGNHLRKLIDKLVTKILLESQWLDWKEYKMRIFILFFFSCLFILVHRW